LGSASKKQKMGWEVKTRIIAKSRFSGHCSEIGFLGSVESLLRHESVSQAHIAHLAVLDLEPSEICIDLFLRQARLVYPHGSQSTRNCNPFVPGFLRQQ